VSDVAAARAEVDRRIVSGAFVLVDKPRGPSSHQVTAWARDLLGVATAGHAGTLDPNVSGVLWVAVGPALKLVPLVLEFPKRYIAVVAFHAPLERARLERLLSEFTGPIFQTPPVRSAVKRERRIRTIHRLVLLEATPTRALLDITADSGTYVRTLAVDLGEASGAGGNMEELRRVATGPFDEREALSLTQLADAKAQLDAGDPAPMLAALQPVARVWTEFPTIELKESAASAVAHGAGLAAGGISKIGRAFPAGARVVLVNRAQELIAVGVARADSTSIAGRSSGWVVDRTRVFADPARYPPMWKAATRAAAASAADPHG
jgi:H/ACA ribonucleoprotein complex subunit 4